MEKKAEAMAKYGKAAMTEMIIKVLPEMAEAIAKPLESIDKVTIIDGGSGENGVGTFSGNVPSVLAKTIESIKETTGFDLTEVMKANTYDAKTTKNVNFKIRHQIENIQSGADFIIMSIQYRCCIGIYAASAPF